MTKKTARSAQYSNLDPVLFLALELGWSEWKLGFSTGLGQKPRHRSMPAGDLGRLETEIRAAKRRFGLAASTRVVSCYEAGRDGFWMHRFLVSKGIGNDVVDSSSIEVNRRARRAKTDSLDTDKLLVLLIRYHLGDRRVWSVVRVPTVHDEDARQLHREVRTLQKERTRTSNRIKGLLANQGVRATGRLRLSEKELGGLRLWDGSPLPMGLRRRLERELELLGFLRKKILELEAERRRLLSSSREAAVEKMRRMMSLRGIGESAALILVRELFGWRRFDNRRQVGALIGLTPTPYQSGESSREQGISKSGNRLVRSLAVELAWIWLRYQPRSRLARWYAERFAKGGARMRRVGIVAVARRLIIDLWRFVEFGVLPEGAELKAE